jgi:branched-chain amino acid transport system permease protein
LSLFLQQIINGLTLGSIYGLVALGLTLVYGILHIPNFAHGALYMVGAFMSYFFMVDLGAHYWIAMAGSAAVVAVLAILCERLVFHPLRHSPPIHDKIAAIGILLFLEAVVQMFWGSDFRRMSSPFTGILNFDGLIIPEQRLLIIAGAFVLVVALQLFLRKTMTGATIIAMAQSREGAFLVGIDANRGGDDDVCDFGHAGRVCRHTLCAHQSGVSRHGAPGHHESLRHYHTRWHG